MLAGMVSLGLLPKECTSVRPQVSTTRTEVVPMVPDPSETEQNSSVGCCWIVTAYVEPVASCVGKMKDVELASTGKVDPFNASDKPLVVSPVIDARIV